MESSDGIKPPLPGYKKVDQAAIAKRIPQGKEAKFNPDVRVPTGTTVFQDASRELIIPDHTDFPTESGFQMQIVDRTVDLEKVGESPIFSDKVDPKSILRSGLIGIVAEEQLVKKTDNLWVNFNIHSRPPMTTGQPLEVRYGPLTIDIHGRSFSDQLNWTKPPPIRAGWGMKGIEDQQTEVGGTASREDIEKYRIDPMHRVDPDAPPVSTNPADFEGWKDHPSGLYNWAGNKREYSKDQVEGLKKVFGEGDFKAKYESLKGTKLFEEGSGNFTPVFPPLPETDTVLWQKSFEGRSYRLVTQKTPLVDESEGIHMVLQIYPEPHTPWDSPTQTLEALAIGVGVSRLLQNTGALGPMGDAYLDFNANWSMTSAAKKAQLDELVPDDTAGAKAIIQKDTRAHLHIQLEKSGAKWELPPAPGTFGENKPQKPETVAEISDTLGKTLTPWLRTNCAGSLF